MKKKRWLTLLLIVSLCLSFSPFSMIVKATESSKYIDTFVIDRGFDDEGQVYLLSEALNAEQDYDRFQFNPDVTEYSIMLPDGAYGAVALQMSPRITSKNVENLWGNPHIHISDQTAMSAR